MTFVQQQDIYQNLSWETEKYTKKYSDMDLYYATINHFLLLSLSLVIFYFL